MPLDHVVSKVNQYLVPRGFPAAADVVIGVVRVEEEVGFEEKVSGLGASPLCEMEERVFGIWCAWTQRGKQTGWDLWRLEDSWSLELF